MTQFSIVKLLLIPCELHLHLIETIHRLVLVLLLCIPKAHGTATDTRAPSRLLLSLSISLLVLFPFYNPWGSSDPHQIDNQGWGFPKISTLESIYRDYGCYVLIFPLQFLCVVCRLGGGGGMLH